MGSSSSTLRSGRRLGEFVLGEQIGRGGFADVFQASQPSLGRAAVIKVLRGVMSTRHTSRFEREARMACQLDHPFAAHVYAFGVEPDGLMWIAMELVRGISLSDWLETKGPLALGRFVGLFERLCEVVHTAHAAGLIHRDIKPSNVMVVTRAGKLMPKLLDFGIAMAADAMSLPAQTFAAPPLHDSAPSLEDSTDPAHTEDRMQASGTPAYMAPEQWHGTRHDHRVDIYALGVLAYRCLTGRPPFEGRSVRELMDAHQRQPVPRLGDAYPAVLDEVIGRALAKDPLARYSSALELAAAFQRAASGDDEWLPRDEVRAWLGSAPPHLAASVAAITSARTHPDACDATERWLAAVAQWLGVVAIAGVAALEAYVGQQASMLKLTREALTPRDWLELASALCMPFAERDEDFPVPELVAWFRDDGGERRSETLLAALAVAREEPASYSRELVGRVLRSLRFIPGYTLLVGGEEWTARSRVREGEAVWLSDGDRNPLVELSPLVDAAAPAPGEPIELFAVMGGGRAAARQVSYPEGYERDAPTAWPWLVEHFGAGSAARDATITDRAPYRGLAPFSSGDADLYFGRERLIDQLFNRVLTHPFVALTGPSGSGKSSLVQAGLIPRLPGDWIAIAVRPGRTPIAALDAALVEAGVPGLDGTFRILLEWLRGARRRLLLVVDQAEELLTLADAEQRSGLASLLADLVSAGDRVRVAVTLRHDFIGRADELPQWRELIQHNLLLVAVPSREDLAQMVAGPAAQVGYDFDDPRLVPAMVDEVADRPGALPLLSFAASRLWDARDPVTQRMTYAAYVAMGGVGGALARYAEEVFEGLSPHQQSLMRELLRRLVTAVGTSAPARRDELATIRDGAAAVIEHLVGARLLVTSERADGGDEVAIAHEALIDRWPRLAQWRADDAVGARHRDELSAAAGLWDRHGRIASYLWREDALAVYREWAPRWAGTLTATEVAFGGASVRAAKRTRRVRRAVIASIMAGLSLAVAILVALYQRAGESRDEAERRFTDMLVDRGRAELLAERPLRALVYLAAAYERGRDGPGMRHVLGQAARAMDREQSRVRAQQGFATISRQSETLFTMAPDEPVRSWRVHEGRLEPIASFVHEGDYAREAVGVSNTGRTVARGGAGPLRIWARDGTLVGRGENRAAGFNKIALTDELIATDWGGRQAVILWDRTGKQLAVLGDQSIRRPVADLRISDNGEQLLVAFSDGRVELWDTRARSAVWSYDHGTPISGALLAGDRVLVLTNSGEVAGLTMRGERTYRIHAHKTLFGISVGSRVFVTAGAEPTVKVWNLDDGRLRANLVHDAPIFKLAISPDESRLLAQSNESTVSLWDLARSIPLGQIDLGTEVTGVTFSPDGRPLTCDGTGWLQLWDPRGDYLTAAFTEHRAEVFAFDAAPDGKTISTLGADGFVRHWRRDDGAPRGMLTTDNELLGKPFRQDVAYLPDGRLIAPSFLGAAVWDVGRGARVGVLPEYNALQVVAVDKHGRVATANSSGSDAHVVLWDEPRQRRSAYLARPRTALHIAFDATGTRLAIGDKEELSVWDIERDQTWSQPNPGTSTVAFGGDGLVAGSSSDGYVRIRRADTGEIVRSIKLPGRALSVAFSPDGALLATAIANNTIYLWDLATGQFAGRFAGHDNIINDLDFTRDGTRLISVARDGRALVWKVAFETRPPAVLAHLIATRVPIQLVGAELVPNDRR